MSVFNAYMSLSGAIDAVVERDVPLARHTSYHIGGPAALLVRAHSYGALARTLEVLGAERVPWVVLGKGSGVLVSDEGYGGCVIQLDDEFSKIAVAPEDGSITAGAGATLSKVVNEAMKASLSGLEPCVGIPGTVGGALSTDAGTRRERIGRRVRDLVLLEPGEGMRRIAGADVDWGYHTTSLPRSGIVLEATFSLMPAERSAIAADTDARLRRRRLEQPMSLPSCGAVFLDPPERSAAELVAACGLAGATCGGAEISAEHTNFVVNRDHAQAADVVALIGAAHDAVLKRFGVDLACRVKLLGFGR